MQFQPKGYCIYCGSTDESLSDEHIIAFGLAGKLVLPKASCSKCAAITSAVEGKILRGEFLPFRIVANLPTRRRKDRPEKLIYALQIGDAIERIERTPKEGFALLLLPLFNPPGLLTGSDYGNTMSIRGWDRLNFGMMPAKPEKGGTQKLEITVTMNPTEFLLMIIKIAYASVCVDLDRTDFDENYAEDLLLGRRHDAANFVGSDSNGQQLRSGPMHTIKVFEVEIGGHIYAGAKVHLFGKHGSTPYEAIVGRRKSPTK